MAYTLTVNSDPGRYSLPTGKVQSRGNSITQLVFSVPFTGWNVTANLSCEKKREFVEESKRGIHQDKNSTVRKQLWKNPKEIQPENCRGTVLMI